MYKKILLLVFSFIFSFILIEFLLTTLGRYNELTRILSKLQGYDKSTNSVGGIVRPEILHNFKLNQGIK